MNNVQSLDKTPIILNVGGRGYAAASAENAEEQHGEAHGHRRQGRQGSGLEMERSG